MGGWEAVAGGGFLSIIDPDSSFELEDKNEVSLIYRYRCLNKSYHTNCIGKEHIEGIYVQL